MVPCFLKTLGVGKFGRATFSTWSLLNLLLFGTSGFVFLIELGCTLVTAVGSQWLLVREASQIRSDGSAHSLLKLEKSFKHRMK